MPVKQKGALYLLRDKFQIYIPGLPTILECRFPSEIVRDMDIISQEMFANLIKVFITNAKIPPSTLVITIADSASFIKDFFQQPTQPPAQPGQPAKPQQAPVTMEELEKKAKEFANMVPFEEIASKIMPVKLGYRAYATNKDLFEAIKSAFEENGCEIVAVIPAIAFGPEVSSKPAMDGVVAGEILRKYEGLVKQHNLLNQPILTLEPERDKDTDTEITGEGGVREKPKSQLPLLLGVFGFLIIVLILVAWTQLGPKPKPTSTPLTQTAPVVQATVAPTAILTPATASASASEIKLVTVQITNTIPTIGAATSLHDALVKYGFKSVTIVNGQNTAAPATSVTFSKNVNTAIRSLVISEVQKLSPLPTILDKADAVVDITILLAK